MTEVYRDPKMRSEDEGDLPTKCRERRRRRIEMRRLAGNYADGSSFSTALDSRENRSESSDSAIEGKGIHIAGTADPASQSASSGEEIEPSSASPSATQNLTLGTEATPFFGFMSIAGRSREMQDAISVRTNLCRPKMIRRRPVHFFGVYDGHGGPHVKLTTTSLVLVPVAAQCRERMHVFMGEELMRVGGTAEIESGVGSSSSGDQAQGLEEADEGWWRTAMRRCFERMDAVSLNTGRCGCVGYQCKCPPIEAALAGSTAVVAILTANDIIVANCGDSRAVLCRAGRALPLSSDHKPDRADELARIEASGGQIVYGSVARVQGVLAMSRALGDKYLKPFVIAEPEISFTKRDPEDECLILASDGLWDVLSNDLACEVASKCLRGESPPPAGSRVLPAMPRMEDEGAGASHPTRSAAAAALLTRLALGRKSSDNISVIVVDLRRS